MRKTIFALSLLLLISVASKAQSTFSVKGSTIDTASKSNLHNASALVLRAKDSIMVKFTRIDQTGHFAINNLPAGKYLLLVTYPEYADYSESFALDATAPTHDFGKINMVLKSKLLADIIIRAKPTAIKIKGDTTVFNASAYVVQPNAKVEDLIKQFPGIQVDKDGKITANGQTVAKMLVGGEEFFGDDPTLVTKNIRADMVKEVQMFEKKSDQAAFTGIDDGKKTLTMNVVLKDDKKNGYFGKVDAGIGTRDFYSGQLMYNKFAGKEKFAVNGTLANTGKTGLNFEDSQKYGDGNNVTVMDGGGIMISSGANDLSYNGQGLPVARTGGVHYDNKWDKDKKSINTNYKIGQLDVDGTANSLVENNLPGRKVSGQDNPVPYVNKSNSDQKFSRSAFRQKLDGSYLLTIDTSSNIKITADGTLRNSKSKTDNLDLQYTDEGHPGKDVLTNYQTRTLNTETDQRQMNTSAFYTKKLKKKGRTISVLVSDAVDNSKKDEFSVTHTEYYNKTTGSLDSTKNVNQYKPGTSRSNVFNSNFTYSEPISKSLSIIANYGINVSSGKSEQLTFNKGAGDDYNQRVDSLSNSLTLNQFAHQAGAILNYVKGKTTLNFGTRISDVQFKQIDNFTQAVYERHFINWMPQLTYQYRMGTQANLRVNYNGNTTQPSITQLQPLRNNTNPLFQTIGNPNLKPSFANRFNMQYSSYKALSGQNFYISGGYSFTTNDFVSNTATDGSGKTISQTVNITDRTPYNYNVNAGIGRTIKGPNIQLSLSTGVNSNISYNMVNNVLNTSKSGSYSVNLSIQKYATKKYEIYLSGGPRYNINESSLQQVNSNSTGFNGYGYFTVYTPGKFQISSDVDYTYNGKTATLPSLTRAIVNASIAKTLLKDNTLKVTAAVNDLFNQNSGFRRTVNGSQISQNTNTTIKRYFMLSVSWDFNKMGGAAPKK